MATTTPPVWEVDPSSKVLPNLWKRNMIAMFESALRDLDKSADVEDASYYQGVMDGLEQALNIMGFAQKKEN